MSKLKRDLADAAAIEPASTGDGAEGPAASVEAGPTEAMSVELPPEHAHGVVLVGGPLDGWRVEAFGSSYAWSDATGFSHFWNMRQLNWRGDCNVYLYFALSEPDAMATLIAGYKRR